MKFKSKYISKKPDEKGFINYTDAQNHVWKLLYQRQVKLLEGRACQEHIRGIQQLNYRADQIPQLPEVSSVLKRLTGWVVHPVDALISHEEFFQLLSERRFPAATFIRRLSDLDYITEPDIFHEIFGHCPILTHPAYADFVCDYAHMVLAFDKTEWPLLQRLFWFTVEFGLIHTSQGLRAYGGGILSSKEETVYCVESDKPERRPFIPLDVFRTPYRIDMLQPVYFVIESYQQLYDFLKSDIASLLKQAHQLGEFPAKFPIEPDNPSVHIFAC